MERTPLGPPPISRNPLRLVKYVNDIRKDSIGFVGERFRLYGDMYYAPLGKTRLYVTRHPDHIREVLQTKGQKFGKTTTGNAAKQLHRVLGDGLLNSNGDLWKRQRKLINPAFHRRRIESHADFMVQATLEMIEGWSDGQEVDVSRAMMELTLRIVAQILFDHDPSGDTDTVAATMRAFRDLLGTPALLPEWVPLPSIKRSKEALAAMDELVYGLIDERRAAGNLDGRNDLLSELVSALDDGSGMTRKLLRDELLTLFLAGHETTSHALTWTFYLLSENRKHRGAAAHEVADVLGDRRATAQDHPTLETVGRCIDEGMRLYPPAYVISRTALEDVEIGGYDIPTGAEVLIWIYHTHHDARWYPEPERFDPDRWLPDAVAARPKSSYVPFGGGTRTCVGKHLALMEARLILASVLQHVELDLAPGQIVAKDPTVTLAPKHGMRMTVRRLPSPSH
jgi:cytochrome P450